MNDIVGYILLGLLLYWLFYPRKLVKELRAKLQAKAEEVPLSNIVLDYVTCIHEDGPEQYIRDKYGDRGIRRLRASGQLWRTAVNLRRAQVLGSTARAVYRSNRRQANVGIHTLVVAMRTTYRTTINGELGTPPMTEHDEILAGLDLLVEQAEIDTMEDLADEPLIEVESADTLAQDLIGEYDDGDEPDTGAVPTRKGRRLR